MTPAVRRRGFELGSARSRIVRLLTVAGFVVGAAGFYRGSRTFVCPFGDSPDDRATLTVKKLAYEAFPAWALAHPERRCPDQLEELLEFMNAKDISDPWGRDYRFRCKGGERQYLVVWSAGPDRRHTTDDDIRSDQ